MLRIENERKTDVDGNTISEDHVQKDQKPNRKTLISLVGALFSCGIVQEEESAIIQLNQSFPHVQRFKF